MTLVEKTRTIIEAITGPASFRIDTIAADIQVFTPAASADPLIKGQNTKIVIAARSSNLDAAQVAHLLEMVMIRPSADGFVVDTRQAEESASAASGAVVTGNTIVTGDYFGSIQVGRRNFSTNVVRSGSVSNVQIGGNRSTNVIGLGLTVRLYIAADSHLTAMTMSGDVDTQGGVTSVTAKTMSGDVDIDQVNNAEVKTMSGDVDIANLTQEARVKTMSGDVTVAGSATATAQVTTMSGDIRSRTVRLQPSTISGDIRQR